MNNDLTPERKRMIARWDAQNRIANFYSRVMPHSDYFDEVILDIIDWPEGPDHPPETKYDTCLYEYMKDYRTNIKDYEIYNFNKFQIYFILKSFLNIIKYDVNKINYKITLKEIIEDEIKFKSITSKKEFMTWAIEAQELEDAFENLQEKKCHP